MMQYDILIYYITLDISYKEEFIEVLTEGLRIHTCMCGSNQYCSHAYNMVVGGQGVYDDVK